MRMWITHEHKVYLVTTETELRVLVAWLTEGLAA